jgi:hypothetical protein
MKKSEIRNIFDNGIRLADWAIDINEFGDLESNGGREFLVTFENKYYCIQTNWQEEPFGCSEVIKANEEIGSFIMEMIDDYEKGL